MSINLIVRIRVNYTILVQTRFYVSDFVFHSSQYPFGCTIDVDFFANLFVAKMYVHILAEDRDLSPCKDRRDGLLGSTLRSQEQIVLVPESKVSILNKKILEILFHFL